jgi:putative endonuclease
MPEAAAGVKRTRAGSVKRGAAGEDCAVVYLSRNGWTVRDRNFRTRGGEIDIIAEKEGTVSFIEVKSWRALPVDSLEFSIDGRKRRKIARTARFYLSRAPELAGMRLRFDVLFIGGGAEPIRHIENAFGGGID